MYNVAVSDTVASIAGAGSITLGSNTLTSGGSDASTTFSGVISGTNGNIIKAGTGTALTGNNSYTGSTTISAGLLKIIRDDPTSYLAATSGFTGLVI